MTESEREHLRSQLADIYNDMRNVCLTKKHYEYRLSNVQRFNQCYEGVLAFGTSSAVAGWSFWSDASGATVWLVIGAVTAVLSIVKPIVNLSDEINRLSVLATKYAAMHIDFRLLVQKIKKEEQLSDTSYEIYQEIFRKLKDLGVREGPPPSDRKLRRLAELVNREFPPTYFWSPQ